MRRPPTCLSRFARAEDGLTAVEYAVLVGLVMALAGAATFWLGRGVSTSSGHVAWSSGSGGASVAHSAATSYKPIMATAAAGGSGSVWPWILLTLAVTLGCAGAFVGYHYVRDAIRHGHTRKVVRQSMVDAGGQKAIERVVHQASRRPAPRIKKLDTHLIGRHGPELHRLLREREPSPMMQVIDAAVTVRPTPAPAPAVPVAG
jgi:Flp pilus assembly pilin Flp